MDEAITAAGIGATIDRLVDKADTMAEKLKQSRFMAKDRTKFADALVAGAKRLEDIAGGLREDVIGEASQPRLNKYDPGSLLGWVVYLLEKHGLDDAVDDVKELSRKVSKAWQGRER